LPEVRSPIYFELLREWLRSCDKRHGCHPGSNDLLPTRVLDVGDHRNSNSLRLYSTNQDERGRYIALSHRWGGQQFCTYHCNIDALRESINFGELPKTFQDAIIVTRELGVRFLWIDSVCIIQPHENCSDECRGTQDWDIESKKMEMVYSSAYCTIAASSARNSTEGFLGPRLARPCVKLLDASGSPFFICEAIDDFHRDVQEGELNRRGWVLQERALSRRMIHFTTTQTYWECGKAVRCESLGRMSK
jgi:hypothetical protein